MNTSNVVDNPAKTRFELETPSGLAEAHYKLRDGVINFTHTEVPSAERGQGVASQLARGALDQVRERGLRVVATCPYMAAFIKRHSEYHDLLDDDSG